MRKKEEGKLRRKKVAKQRRTPKKFLSAERKGEREKEIGRNSAFTCVVEEFQN